MPVFASNGVPWLCSNGETVVRIQSAQDWS